MERFHEIGIFPNSNGITVRIGCMTLVYQQSQLDMFHNDLALYLNDPLAAEKDVRKRWHIEQAEDEALPEEATEERAPGPSTIRRAVLPGEKEAESPR